MIEKEDKAEETSPEKIVRFVVNALLGNPSVPKKIIENFSQAQNALKKSGTLLKNTITTIPPKDRERNDPAYKAETEHFHNSQKLVTAAANIDEAKSRLCFTEKFREQLRTRILLLAAQIFSKPNGGLERIRTSDLTRVKRAL